jgi:hypothetical protein
VIASTLLACGASYHTVYEGDVRFEHCYRLDADATVPAASRLACWSDWTHNHTSGQTRDRVEYALGRERTLLGGESQPAGPKFLFAPGATSSALLASSGPAIACPLPASPYENPPATLPAPTPVASVAKDPPGMTTSQLCVRDCGNQFTTCATKCKRSTCVTKCGDLAKSCIGDCLLT